MDIQLKERLVGAAVLVLLGVIFIPMVLDGPGGKQRIQQNVELPPKHGQRTVRIDLAPDKPEQAMQPAVEEKSVDLTENSTPEQPAANTVVATPVPESGKPAESRPAESTPLRETASTPSGEWTVQVGSFSQQANADTLAAELVAKQYSAWVSRFQDGKTIHYRVRVGGYPDRDAAVKAAEQLKSATGLPARPAPLD